MSRFARAVAPGIPHHVALLGYVQRSILESDAERGAMADKDIVSQTFDKILEWGECGERLRAIVAEVKEEINEAPLCVTETGEYFLHPVLSKRLHEPGNQGPLEFLRYMQRNGIC